MFNSLFQSKTLDSSRSNVRLTKPQIVIRCKIGFSNRMVEPSISIAINNHWQNCSTEQHFQHTLIRANALTHSFKWITGTSSSIHGIFHCWKQKTRVSILALKNIRASVLTLTQSGHVYLSKGKYTYPRASILTLQ